MDSKISVALVGLRFGAEFIPIYLHHPDVNSLTICDTDDEVLSAWGDRYQVDRRAHRLEEILASKEVDAVHLVTPVNIHAEQSIAILEAGKHCACTIPMGLSIDELMAVIAAQRKEKKNYMMMETAIFRLEETDVAAEVSRFMFQTGQVVHREFRHIRRPEELGSSWRMRNPWFLPCIR